MGKTISELQSRYKVLQCDLRSINDAAEADGRTALTADEEKRFNELSAEAEAIKRQLRVAAMSEDKDLRDETLRAVADLAQEHRITSARAAAGAEFRKLFESRSKKSSAEMALRSASVVLSTDVAGAIAVTVGDMIEPLEKGLILNKLGLKVLTGLSGDYKYPIIPYVEAKIENEGVAATSSDFDIDALTPKPKRLTLSTAISNWAITQSDIVLYNVVVNAVTQSVMRTINRWMFQPSAITSNTYGALAYNAESNAIHQVSIAEGKIFAGIQSLVGKVEGTGAYNDGTCAYVMSAKMAAKLRATPIGNGDKMVLDDNNTISGFPVFFTEFIESKGDGTYNADASHIGFGRWSDVQVGQFGNMRLTIDPYSRHKEDLTEITINANFSVDVLRPGSFAIGTIA